MAMTFNQKLLELQKRIEPIKKENDNPFFQSKYFDINALVGSVKPVLNELGLVLLQPITTDSGIMYLKTVLADTDSEGKVDSQMPLPTNLEPQKLGSAITYYRRYMLQALLSLEAEDDDGNVASHTQEAQKETSEFPLCKDCGSVQVLSKNTGKPYCKAMCWKKKTEKKQETLEDIPF